jgi:hypothetical protein
MCDVGWLDLDWRPFDQSGCPSPEDTDRYEARAERSSLGNRDNFITRRHKHLSLPIAKPVIRAHKLNTALSGFCISSCSRMFLGGVQRQYSDEQPLDKTYVGLHGNYAADGSLQAGRMGYLKNWVIKYSDGKANPDLVEQWVHIPNHHGYIAFYHRDATILPGTQKVMLCQGTEDRGKRQEQCAKPEMGDALANGIVTTWEIYPLRVNAQQAD